MRLWRRATSRQRKVLHWAIWSQGRSNELQPCAVAVEEFAGAMGLTSGSIHGELRRAVDGLQRATVYPGGSLFDRNGKRAAHGPVPWVTSVDFSRPGILRFTLNGALSPYLTNLTASFTQVRLHALLNLKSTYAIALWERLELHRGLHLKEWDVSGADLRQWLGLSPGQYPGTARLCTRVLDRARSELGSLTDQSFNYSVDRYGRDDLFRFTVIKIPRPSSPAQARVHRQSVTLETDPLSIMHDCYKLRALTRLRLETGTPPAELKKLIGYARARGRGVSAEWSDEQIKASPEFLEWVQWLVSVFRTDWLMHQQDPARQTPFLGWLRTGTLDWTPQWLNLPSDASTYRQGNPSS